MTLEHARRAAGERPQPHRLIPRRRGQCCPVGRHRKCGDRRGMAFQHGIGLGVAGSPDGDAAVGACGRRAAVSEQCHRVDGVGMETQHLFGRIARQRPADRGRIEAAGNRGLSVGRNRQCPHRAAMAAQLRRGCRYPHRQQGQQGQKYEAAFWARAEHSPQSSRPFAPPSRAGFRNGLQRVLGLSSFCSRQRRIHASTSADLP